MLLLPYRQLGPPTLLLGYTRPAAAPQVASATEALGAPASAKPGATGEPASARPGAPSARVTSDVGTPSMSLDPLAALDAPPAPASAATPLKKRSNDAFAETPPPPGRPRLHPEPQIDPRTVYKQRTGPSTRLEPRAPVTAPSLSDGPVSDLLIVPTASSFRVSDQGVKAVLGYLRSTQILTARNQKTTPDGATAIELLPDVFVHLAFTDEGGAPPGPPCIAEGYLWFSSKPAKLPFGPARDACFRLELVGVRYDRVSDAFLARLHSILYLKPELVAVPHEPRRLRKPAIVVAAEPIPLFDIQER